MTKRALILCTAIAAASISTRLLASELFLRPVGTPPTAEKPAQQLRLTNGSWLASENSISRDRMTKVTVLVNGKATTPPLSDWSDADKSTYLNFLPAEKGTYVVGLSTRARVFEMSRKDFTSYLKQDGITDALADFDSGKVKLEKIRERYSKHVRTIIQVGDKVTTDYRTPLGFPLEILLENNPAEAKVGDRLSFRVLYDGKPVVNQFVRASYDGFAGNVAEGAAAQSIRTDKDGRGTVLISNSALWYLSMIHMEKVDQPDADYESNWATVTFSVK